MAKDNNKNKYEVIDTIDYEIGNVSNLKDEFKTIKDASGKRYLEIEVDVTHGGYVNKNYYYYEPEGQAKAAASFFNPYPKPVLAQHISMDTPVGRTYAAAYIPLKADIEDALDLKKPKSKIRVKSVITDEKAIDYILDRRYLTVSSGGNAIKPPRCSICNETLESMGPLGSVPGCSHRRGKKYTKDDDDDGKKELCYWKIGEMEYKEYSFVNMPADHTPEHVASIVSAKFVDPSAIDSPMNVAVDNSGMVDSNCPINDELDNKNTDKNNNTGGIAMVQDNVQDDKNIDFFAIFTLDSDNCPECKDEEWKDEKEIKEAEAFDEDFCKTMELVFGIDDKVLPRAGSKERQAMKTTFCGPNKTFPIPDCKHAAVALAMLNWPRVKAKYSDSVRARIASCVRGRGKTLGCPMSKKKDAVPAATSQQDNTNVEGLKELQDQVKKLHDEITQLKTTGQEKEAETKKANDQITTLNEEIKRKLAEKVIDMSMMANRNSVQEIMAETNEEKRKEIYDSKVEDFMKRSVESLNDSIKDLSSEVSFDIKDAAKVDDPNKVKTPTQKKEEKNEEDSTSVKLFGKDQEGKK